MITAYYNAFWEELKTGEPIRNKLLLALRIILFTATVGFIGFMLFVTLLAKQEASKTEIMSLYICILYTIFLLGNFLSPWKVIAISKRLRNFYVLTLL